MRVLRNRITAVLVAMAVFLLAAIADAGTAEGAGPKEVKLGFISSVTGSAAEVGKAMQHAAELAVAEVNKSGGVEIAGRKYPIKLVIADDEGPVAERASTATQRLIEQDQVLAIIGYLFSSNVLVAAPVAQRAKTPLVNAVGAALTIPEKIAKEKMDYIFSVSLTTEEWATDMAGVLAHYVKPKKVAAMQLNTDSARVLERALRTHLPKAMPGVELLFLYKEANQMDFGPEMLKLKQFNPDALIFHWAGTPTFAFVDQLYDSGMGKRVVVYGIGDYSAPDFPARTAPKTNLHLVHAITNKAAITPLTVPFFEAYEKATGKAPPYYAVQQYDSMLLMFEGLRRVKELTGDVAKDRQAIRDALDTITQSKPVTATRGTLHFEPLEKGHRVLAPAAVVQIQSGERVLVWPAGPAAGKFIDPRK